MQHLGKGKLKHWCKAHESMESSVLLLHTVKVWISLVWLSLHSATKIVSGL